MNQPPFEVADLVRAAGSSFVEKNRSRLTWQHLRVLRALERCRTAALGGHLDQCSRCGEQAISYNSCLMGSFSLWGVDGKRGMLHVASRPFASPLRLALQKGE